MQFSGSTEFAADRARVWGYLIDPTRLGPCSPIPIERVDDRHFRATTRVGSGFFAATVKVDVEVIDVVEGQSATIHGNGGASGTSVDARSTFTLRDGSAAGRTVVDWVVDVTPSGMFAPAISKVIGERGQESIDQVLRCVRGQVEGR